MKRFRVLIIFALIVLTFLVVNFYKPTLTQSSDLSRMSFDQLKKYFSDLAEKKGAKVAFETLKNANVPPNTDTHLLGHIVGDVLYKEEGLDGIQICTNDFRNACSHSIVTGIFTDKGEEALPEISQACRQAPGGLGAYTMCFHGLGHGILAYKMYDLEKTIQICQKTNGSGEIAQCISGAVMEIISGGGHDKSLWSKKRKQYLLADNPSYPCSADFMPEVGKSLCYNYLTPFLWEAVGADVNNPKEEDFIKAFALCGSLPEKDKKYQSSCFGGFGKEFTTLVQNKDIRKIDQMSTEQLLKVYSLCNLNNDKEGTKECLSQALSSIYWGGENDRAASINFCKVIPDEENFSNCFSNLIGQVSNYIKDRNYRQSFCQEIPEQFRKECQKRLS